MLRSADGESRMGEIPPEASDRDRPQVQIDGAGRSRFGTPVEFVGHRLCMNIGEVRPSKEFRGAWVAFEAPGVEPAFAAPDAKRKANRTIDRLSRFGEPR